jgi:hypothetical protein
VPADCISRRALAPGFETASSNGYFDADDGVYVQGER